MISTLVYSRSTSRCNAASRERSAKHRVEAATNTGRFLGRGVGFKVRAAGWLPTVVGASRGDRALPRRFRPIAYRRTALEGNTSGEPASGGPHWLGGHCLEGEAG